jgi:hypothetical protein
LVTIMKLVALNKSSLLLKIQKQNTRTVLLKCQRESLDSETKWYT